MSNLQSFLDDYLCKVSKIDDYIDNDFVQFGREIKRYRLLTGLTQKELSVKTGISQACLSNIEKGRYNLSIKQLLRIVEGLNCKVVFRLEGNNGR